MKRLALSLFISLLMVGSSAADPVKWTDYNTAIAKAKEENKPVYVYFYSDRCTWCNTMKKETHQNKAVADYLNDHFIAVKVDAGKDRDLAMKFRVGPVPANWFLSPDGKPLGQRLGYIPADTFQKMLKIVHTGKHEK